MTRRLFSHQLNYALILLLLSLLAYSSMGLCLGTSSVQADTTLPVGEEDAPAVLSCSFGMDAAKPALGLLQ